MAVTIVANRAQGLKAVGKNQLVQQKAEAAIAVIEADNTQLQADNAQITTDIAALPGADNATLKLILGRVLQELSRTNQVLIKNNNRQKRIIQYLAGG